jgi:hypothetical protein
LVALLLLWSIQPAPRPPQVEAQSTITQAPPAPPSTATMLTGLHQRMVADPNFMIAIQVEVPFTSSGQTWLRVPHSDAATATSLYIDEVGADYVCLVDAQGTTAARRCTRISNIISLAYLVNR